MARLNGISVEAALENGWRLSFTRDGNEVVITVIDAAGIPITEARELRVHFRQAMMMADAID